MSVLWTRAVMITGAEGKVVHVVLRPAGGRGKCAKDFLRGFVMRFLSAALSDVEEQRGSVEDAPGGPILQDRSAIRSREGIKKAESEIGGFARGRKFGIENRCRSQQASHGRGFSAAPLRKTAPPDT